jgi:hypothetical protein
VNALSYSSITAFLAHRDALRAFDARSPEQSARLGEIESLIEQLSPPEREFLDQSAATGEPARHRERAERHLIQILRQHGALSG